MSITNLCYNIDKIVNFLVKKCYFVLKNNNMPEKIVENQEKVGDSRLNELKKGLSVVENKERALNSRKMIEENKLKENRARLLQQLFAAMQDMGGDPSNLESINEFLSMLAKQDPDLLQMFEIGFSGLQGDPVVTQDQENSQPPVSPTGQAVPQASPEQEPSLTNNFENLRNQALNRG